MPCRNDLIIDINVKRPFLQLERDSVLIQRSKRFQCNFNLIDLFNVINDCNCSCNVMNSTQ